MTNEKFNLNCDSQIKGYNNGLFAAASFMSSGKSFESWYNEGPVDIPEGWKCLLEVLGREKEYYDLKLKISKETTDAPIR